jgi:uncharacterized protein YbjQ (UPF0145 family)
MKSESNGGAVGVKDDAHSSGRAKGFAFGDGLDLSLAAVARDAQTSVDPSSSVSLPTSSDSKPEQKKSSEPWGPAAFSATTAEEEAKGREHSRSELEEPDFMSPELTPWMTNELRVRATLALKDLGNVSREERRVILDQIEAGSRKFFTLIGFKIGEDPTPQQVDEKIRGIVDNNYDGNRERFNNAIFWSLNTGDLGESESNSSERSTAKPQELEKGEKPSDEEIASIWMVDGMKEALERLARARSSEALTELQDEAKTMEANFITWIGLNSAERSPSTQEVAARVKEIVGKRYGGDMEAFTKRVGQIDWRFARPAIAGSEPSMVKTSKTDDTSSRHSIEPPFHSKLKGAEGPTKREEDDIWSPEVAPWMSDRMRQIIRRFDGQGWEGLSPDLQKTIDTMDDNFMAFLGFEVGEGDEEVMIQIDDIKSAIEAKRIEFIKNGDDFDAFMKEDEQKWLKPVVYEPNISGERLRYTHRPWFDGDYAKKFDDIMANPKWENIDPEKALKTIDRSFYVAIELINDDNLTMPTESFTPKQVRAAMLKKLNDSFGGDYQRFMNYIKGGAWMLMSVPEPNVQTNQNLASKPDSPLNSANTDSNLKKTRQRKSTSLPENPSVMDVARHYKDELLVTGMTAGAAAITTLFADANNYKAAGFALATGTAFNNLKNKWSKTGALVRGFGASAVGLFAAEAFTGGYHEKGQLIAAAIGAGLGISTYSKKVNNLYKQSAELAGNATRYGFLKGTEALGKLFEKISSSSNVSRLKRHKWKVIGGFAAAAVAGYAGTKGVGHMPSLFGGRLGIWDMNHPKGSSSETARTVVDNVPTSGGGTNTASTLVGHAPAPRRGTGTDSTIIENLPRRGGGSRTGAGEAVRDSITERYKNEMVRQRSGVRLRARELGVELPEAKVSTIVSDAFKNLEAGKAEDLERLVQNPKFAQAMTDRAILDAAGV